VEEGEQRLHRDWPELLATGAVGGVDIAIGVFALLVVHEATGSPLLGALAFGIGFLALTIGSSELFTENFLIPISALAAERGGPVRLLRLWVFTLLLNLAAGWLLTLIVISGFPELEETAVEVARHYTDLGIGWESFAAAILGGVVITLMTWLQHATESIPARLAVAVAIAFVLAAAPLNHVIVVSLELFAALHAGAPFDYLDWLQVAGWGALGNIVGGVGFVTLLRLVQVGPQKIEEEQPD
jgi:formate-nitrite transporter family protein